MADDGRETCSASVNLHRFDALHCIVCIASSAATLGWAGLDRVIIATANQQQSRASAPNLLSM
jgi:hypothetical protein